MPGRHPPELGRGRARRDANVRRWTASGGATGFAAGKKDAWKKFAILVFVEPCAFDIKQLDARETGKRERVNGELSNWPIRARIGLVVEDVDGAVSDLKEIDVAGDRTFGACRE